MTDKGFTSGEKRGLIVLLVVMAVIVGWSVISKGCASNVGQTESPSDRMIMIHDSLSHINDSVKLIKQSKRKTKTRKVKVKSVKPDGLKRDYLSEPVN
ncbi:MAG: hypothetical protein K2H50_01005 [Paramuribaculum sp.]|nr:hypothetical protein [Paramuribaculum sp.]MDE5835571.1 hypothetical protein [Paramuribaculum sp.]